MITLRAVTLQRGAKRLLEGASLTVLAGQKLGIVGANGTGKSSLLAFLRGELHCEAGDVDIKPGLTIAQVVQETAATADAALDYVLDGDRELREIEAAISASERENVVADRRGADQAHGEHAHGPEHLGDLHERLASIGGYGARARAAQILYGLGFSQTDLARPVAEFSGGWRMRLNLAQALMTRSDLLLLDEPTNHLDLDAVLWLEDWLSRYGGTLLLISHDREFLDNTVDHICHLDNRMLKLYKGNYSEFELQRAAGLQTQQAAYEKQQREIAHLRHVRPSGSGLRPRKRARPRAGSRRSSGSSASRRCEQLRPSHSVSASRSTPRRFCSHSTGWTLATLASPCCATSTSR